MGIFDQLFGDPRGAAARAEATVGRLTRAGEAKIEAASMVVDDRARAASAEQRGIADAFRALADQPSSMERQSIQQAARTRTQGAARQAALSGGPLNASRLNLGELEGATVAQGLLAQHTAEMQAQMQLNQAIGRQLQIAGEFSQAGAAARLQSLTEFQSSALSAQTQAAMMRAQAESQAGPLGKLVGGIFATLGAGGAFGEGGLVTGMFGGGK